VRPAVSQPDNKDVVSACLYGIVLCTLAGVHVEPIDLLKNPGNATLQMTYHQTLNVGLRSEGVHYDIRFRICMHREEKIDRRPGSE
jgi:hypothetical protein